MSNPILQSNESSAVVATVNASTTHNPWIYNEKDRLVVPHSFQVLPVASSSGSVGAHRTLGFDVPKNGIATGFFLEMKLDSNLTNLSETQNNLTSLGMLDCIDTVTLNTSGRVIERLDKYQIMSRLKALPRTRQTTIADELRMGAHYDKTIHTTYLWLPFYMFRDPNRYGIMTNFEEPHHIEVVFSDLKCGHTLHTQTGTNYITYPSNHESNANQLKLDSVSLLVHYRQPDEKTMNSIVAANYADGMLSRLVGISNRESVHTFTNTNPESHQSATIELKENDAVRTMYVAVAVDDDVSSSHNSSTSKKLLKIRHVKLTFNNTDVIDVSAHFLHAYGSNWDFMNATSEIHENASDNDSIKKMVRIDLGHGDDSDLTNVVAFRELSNATLTIEWENAGQSGGTEQDPTYAPVNVHVIYETATFLTTSADTGRVQLSVSS